LKKDNFHQFNSDFHKEKEMVDFRKWILALAVVGLLLGIGSSAANAQGTFSCSATSGVPNIVRAEGITELLGDLVLNCTGGTPTTSGLPIPLQNVQISINTNITSRIVGLGNVSEALLLIDEPYPPGADAYPPTSVPTNGNATTQLACLADNNTNCAITSVGPGLGAVGSYKGTAGHYNIFQGVQTGVNTIAWNGVPIDAPGTAGIRVIRITNIRANAFQLGVSSTLIPTQISEILAVNGSTTITINQPSGGNVVGQVSPGLLQPPGVGVVGAFPGAALYQQCNSVNTYLSPPGTITTDAGIGVSATEGFAYSFKPQSYDQIYEVKTLGDADYIPPGNPSVQDIPGFPYDTESGFTPFATGLTNGTTGEYVGIADHGTQLQFTISGISSGVTLYAPSYVYLTGAYGTGTPIGVAVLVSQGAVSSGAFSASATAIPVVDAPAVGTNGGEVAITTSGTTGTLVYEIYYSDPSVQETLTVPISVSYTSNTGSNIPTPTTTPTTVGVEFSPQSTVTTASSSAPIPRFGPSGSPQSLFSISPCSCNLLFPFVANAAGFDTGIAIANTSAAPSTYTSSPQTGTVTLNYYGTTSGGGAAPPSFTTTSAVPAGEELIFDVSSGGNFGVPATPGFEGYIIAQANFQYCHGFAFLSPPGAQGQGASAGYLAIELDKPGLYRTNNTGENLGH
jgi:hypothetical protein